MIYGPMKDWLRINVTMLTVCSDRIVADKWRRMALIWMCGTPLELFEAVAFVQIEIQFNVQLTDLSELWNEAVLVLLISVLLVVPLYAFQPSNILDYGQVYHG